MKIKKIKYLIILFIGCLLCCRETSEGCLDSTASNFDVTADDDCCVDEDECCCIFPNLELTFFYKQRSRDTLEKPESNFDFGTYYALENSQDSIMIDSFFLFVNQVKPINLTFGDSICVQETLDFTKLDTEGNPVSFRIEDNIALVDVLRFNYILGTYQSVLDVEQINLTLGLPDEIAQIDPDNITSSSNLGNSDRFLFNEDLGSFPSLRVKFTLKSSEQQRVITRELRFANHVSFILSAPIMNDIGADLTISFRINILDVFKGIIFDVEYEAIDSIILDNLPLSISFIK